MKPQTTALQLKALKNGFFRIYTCILVHYILDTCIKTIFYYYTNAIIIQYEDYVGIKFFLSETVHCLLGVTNYKIINTGSLLSVTNYNSIV